MATATNASVAPFCPHNGTTHDGTFLCHWTDGPATRGTLNIVFLCLSTLGICVWSAVHPSVPYPGSSRLRVFASRVTWLLVGLFLPEMLVLTALGELREAMSLLEDVAQAGVRTEFPWWMDSRKAPFLKSCVSWMPLNRTKPSASERDVEMNHLVVRWIDRYHIIYDASSSGSEQHGVSQPISEGQTSPAGARKHPWTLTHSFYAVMGGYFYPPGYVFPETEKSYAPAFARRSLTEWLKTGQDSTSVLDVSADDLNDRSKADGLAKLLLVWQLFVFLVNCAARRNQALPLSLLEITTISHSLCSLVALVIWWYKPHSVGEVTIIGGATVPKTPPGPRLRAAGNMVLPGPDAMDVPRTITIFTISALYGLPYLLGLSVHFPSSSAQLLWKIATFSVIGLPLLMCFLFWIDMGREKDWYDLPPELWDPMMSALMGLSLILYPVCSMFLVGESLKQVFALPEGSFREPQLARYLPSFS